MNRISVGILFLAFSIFATSFAGLAQEQPVEPQLRAQPIVSPISLRGIGLDISFPLSFLPVPVSTATIFADLFFQGPISANVVSRTDVRFFFHFLSGFRFDLTSIRESVLVVFTSAPVVFSIGGGLGTFPIQGVPVGTSDGLLFAFHARANLEIQVSFIGLFLDMTYEVMPQPFADIQAAGSLIPSALEFSVGAIFHF